MGDWRTCSDFYANERQKAQDAGLWFEVRYWVKLPESAIGTPSHWATIGYSGSRNAAAIIAESLWYSREWYCEVWTCNPVVDPDIPPVSSGPVRWHLCDLSPDRRYPHDWPRPASGNPGENPSRWDE